MVDYLSIVASSLTIAAEVSKFINSRSNEKKSTHKIGFDVNEKLNSYLKDEYERVSKVNSFAFEGKRNLLDMYIPSIIESQQEFEAIEIGNILNFKDIEHDKIVIIDSAGMGKSTLSRFIFIKSVETTEYFPVLVEARKFNGSTSLERHIFETIFRDEKYDSKIINDLISYQNTLVIIDGLDEIPVGNKRAALAKISSFVDKYSCKIMLTSRPDDSLDAISSLYRYTMRPLTKKAAYSLLRKFDTLNERYDLLTSKLDSEDNEDIAQFLKNPMMVSLLYRSFEFKNDIPTKKSVFYRQVYDALFNRHDLSKGDAYIREKNSNLDIENFHKVTRSLAFLTYKDSLVEFTKDQILDYIIKCKEFIREFEYKESQYLIDLYSTVPLFIKEGDSYRWTHKSMQEYFASQFICMDAGDSARYIIESMYNSKNFTYYDNIIDLLYDANYKLIEEHLLYDFFKKIKQEVDEKVEKYPLKNISIESVRRRIMINIFCEGIMMPFESENVELMGDDDDGFPVYINKCFNDAAELSDKRRSRSMRFVDDKVCMVIMKNSNKITKLISILRRKNSPIITIVGEAKSHFGERIVDRVTLIDDKRKVYNFKKNFDKTTDMLEYAFNYTIEYSKVCLFIERVSDFKSKPSLFRMR